MNVGGFFNMPLLVKYKNNSIEYVPTNCFQYLLDSGCIIAFKRSNGGWVDPKIGPIRGQGANISYNGRERRSRW